MARRLSPFIAAILSVALQEGASASSPPRIEPLNQNSAALANALRDSEETRDNQPIQEILRIGLEQQSLVEREQVISVVFRNTMNPRLKECVKVLREYSSRDLDSERIMRLADEIEFLNSTKSARIDVYRRALDDGFAGVGTNGWGITRVRAMWSVASEGIGDLRASLEVAGKKLTSAERRRIVVGEALALLDLSAGEGNTGGIDVALERLTNMPSSKLSDGMSRDDDFRNAVTGIARGACPTRDPREAWGSAERCKSVRAVVERLQNAIDSPKRGALSTDSVAAKPTWLDELRVISFQ